MRTLCVPSYQVNVVGGCDPRANAKTSVVLPPAALVCIHNGLPGPLSDIANILRCLGIFMREFCSSSIGLVVHMSSPLPCRCGLCCVVWLANREAVTEAPRWCPLNGSVASAVTLHWTATVDGLSTLSTPTTAKTGVCVELFGTDGIRKLTFSGVFPFACSRVQSQLLGVTWLLRELRHRGAPSENQWPPATVGIYVPSAPLARWWRAVTKQEGADVPDFVAEVMNVLLLTTRGP